MNKISYEPKIDKTYELDNSKFSPITPPLAQHLCTI